MVKDLKEYRLIGTVKDLLPLEKESYASFLEVTYKDNFRAAEYLFLKFPRWSVIAGYYAMHDISKLFLAKKYNLKFSQPEVHTAVIQALREIVKRNDVLDLLEKAEKEYNYIISLHLALMHGKDEREKSQYYTSATVNPSVGAQKASYFIDKLVKPYIQLVEELIKR